MKYDQTQELSDEKFCRLTGVKCSTFAKMVKIHKDADQQKKSRGGRKNKLNIENQLLMALEYVREYRTYFHIGHSYGISQSSAYKAMKWIEDTVINHPDFALPGRKALVKTDHEFEVTCIDGAESPIERPKKQKHFYSGKKKRHTLKSQVVVDKVAHQVICTSFAKHRWC